MFAVVETDAAPLEARVESAREHGSATVGALSYASSGGDRVTAWCVAPRTPGPRAGLVMLHWGFGTRDSFLAEAIALAASGVVALLPNAPGYGGREGARPLFRQAADARDYATRAVRELRRGLDLLCAEPSVDPERLGFVGHSLGASLGGQLAGSDERVRALVLIGGTGTLSQLWLPRADQTERAALAPLDGVAWIGRCGAASLFQYAEHDEFITRADAEAFVAAAPEPKQMTWHGCDHAFDALARRERATWLRERLGFGPLDNAALEAATLPRGERWRYRLVKPLLALARRRGT